VIDLLKSHRGRFATVLADPAWRFANQTGKVAPEHRRLHRYGTMALDEIMALPVEQLTAPTAHLYLWCPNALLPDGLAVMQAWAFAYKSNIVWHKVRKDGGPDGRGVGFYFRNVTELILFGVRGKNARTVRVSNRNRKWKNQMTPSTYLFWERRYGTRTTHGVAGDEEAPDARG